MLAPSTTACPPEAHPCHIKGNFDCSGSPVTECHALSEMALPGEILCSEDLYVIIQGTRKEEMRNGVNQMPGLSPLPGFRIRCRQGKGLWRVWNPRLVFLRSPLGPRGLALQVEKPKGTEEVSAQWAEACTRAPCRRGRCSALQLSRVLWKGHTPPGGGPVCVPPPPPLWKAVWPQMGG